MSRAIDAFWRALSYCLLPRVMLLSVLPVLLMATLTFGLAYFYWEPALDAVRASLDAWSMFAVLVHWLEGIGLTDLRSVLVPLVVVFLSTPLIAVLSLLMVAIFMTPWLVRLVALRRFPALRCERGGSAWGSALRATLATLGAVLALLVSLPLWLVPPLALVLPPVIWGWLNYRVMSYDVLAEHATAGERRELLRRHRGTLFSMGVISGCLGAAPSLLWASGAMAIVFAPVLVPVAVWIYTLTFAFAALWFSHFALSALQDLRDADMAQVLPPAATPATAVTELARNVSPNPHGLRPASPESRP